LPGGTEEHYEEPQSEQPVYKLVCAEDLTFSTSFIQCRYFCMHSSLVIDKVKNLRAGAIQDQGYFCDGTCQNAIPEVFSEGCKPK
jgi:hypothetical protein